MKIEFDKIIVKKIDVSFIEQPPKGSEKSNMSISRTLRFDVNKNNDARVVIRSEYKFKLLDIDQAVIFDSHFKFIDCKNLNFDEYFNDEIQQKIANIVEPIILPQETSNIRRILSMFGASIKDGIPNGVPQDV